MRILALETSTEFCSVALWQDGLMSDRFEQAGQSHSKILLPMVDEVLRIGGVKLSRLDGIAFGQGPGSFTGVRIACGVAQGLAYGAGVPVLGISTLLALAQSAGHSKVIAALDARMAEVYHAAYEIRDGEWHTICEPSLCLPQNAPSLEGNGWAGVGSGFIVHKEQLQEHYAENLASIDEEAVPLASAIAQLAAPMFAEGHGMAAAEALPLYLRDKVALKTSERT